MKREALTVCLLIVLLSPLFSLLQSGVLIASAESSIPKPSVPEFTAAFVDASYDVPTTYSVDPYTGKQVTHGGYHVARRAIEVKITNQPFTPFLDSVGHEIQFYYNIRFKGHYGEWGSISVIYNYGEMPQQSNSEYTVISYNSSSTSPYSFDLTPVSRTLEVSPKGEVDFQVKALVGYTYEAVTVPPFHSTFFVGEESNWSPTQTVTIPPVGSSSSPTFPDQLVAPTPKETQQTFHFEATMEFFPTVPAEVAAIVAAFVAVVVVVTGWLVYFRKRRK